MAIKTINRAKLRNAAKKGKLFAKCDGRYTDDYAYDAAVNFGKQDEFRPVRFYEPGQRRHVEGYITLDADDFGAKSGRAYQTEKGICLIIHSNLSYTVEIRN